MAIETLIIQGEALTIIGADSVVRTRTRNQEKDGQNGLGNDTAPDDTDDNPGLPQYDDYGLRPGYTGEGYVDINGPAGDKLSFEIPAGVPAGEYDVTLRVASNSDRSVAILVDGVQQGGPQNGKTGDFYLWKILTFPVTVPEGEGPHTVVIKQTTGAGPNVDAVALSERGAAVSFAAPGITSDAAFTVSENATEIGVVAASDLDGDAITYAVADGGDGALFQIDPATGALSFVEAPDFEAPASSVGTNTYTLTVTASDGGEPVAQVVTVTVEDVAEDVARPVIEQILLQAEDQPLTLASPADKDSSVQQRNDDDIPGEAAATGKILDAAGLRAGYAGAGYTDYGNDAGDLVAYGFDVAEAGVYTLHIRYASQASGGAPRELALAVNPGAEGEASLGAVVFPDTGGTSGPAETQGFNNWGVLSLDVALKAGANAVTLAIPAGKTSGPNVDAVALTTAGAQANFAAPAFTSEASFEVAQGETAVGAVAATDLDDDTTDGVPAPAPTYAIAGGADADAFTIDPATGALALAVPADAAAKPSYAVVVSATDAEGAVTEQAVTVTVEAPEQPVDQPATGITLTALEVAENAPGAALADIVVADPDTTYAASDLVVSDPATFRVVGEPGALQLALAEGTSLDFEAGAQATVTVSLAASPGVAAEFTPAPSNDPSDDEAPNAAPTALDGTAATDEDTAVGIDLAELIADDLDADDALTVAASSEDGTVAVSGTTLTFTPAADFSGDALISYTVTDTGGLASSATVTVGVAPVDDPASVVLNAVAVAENAPGAVVADIVVTDPDTTYTAADVTVDDDRFVVTGEPGALKLALAEGASLDFEAARPQVNVAVGGASVAFTPVVDDVDEGGPVAVRFDAGTIAGYSTQDRPDQGGAGVSVGDGSSFTLDGNLWKRAPLSQAYTITEDTRITLDLRVGATTPEIVGIGIDSDEDPFNAGGRLYQLGGTQSQRSFVDLRGAGVPNGDGTARFTIDLSAAAGKTVSSLVFVSDDDDARNGLGSATFANVSLVEAADEGGNAAPRVVGGGVAGFSVDEGGAIEVDLPFVDDDGDALTYGFTLADANGAPVAAPEGLGVVDGVLTGPAPSKPGAYTVTLTASDGTADATTSFVLTVDDVNEAPVASDPVLEPYAVAAGKPIAGIDIAQFGAFFTDADEGDTLTLTAENLPAGLSVNDEGVIVGTPRGNGTVTAVIRATDAAGASATIEITFDIDGADLGDSIVVEAEDFTGLAQATNFVATGQAGASGDQIIRASKSNTAASVSTDLSKNGLTEGFYKVAMTFYDETDGSAVYSLRIGDTVLAEAAAFDGAGTQDFPGQPTGSAGQKGNIKTVVFDAPVFVTEGTVLTLSGQADGELLRTDKFTFTKVEAPNGAPSAASLDASAVAENAAGAVVGTLSASDPEGDAITFSVAADSPFEVVDGQLKLKPGVALDFEESAATTVSVTASDGTAQTTGDVTVAVADANDAPTLASGAALADAQVAFGQGGTVDLSVLGATDQDAGDTVSYAVAGAGGTALPAGFAVDGTTLVVPADAPAGAYAVEVFATDGAADSASVSFTVTVGEPVAFEPITIQAEAGTIALAQAADGKQTQVRDADNPETGGTTTLRPDFTGTGYVDYGNDAGDALRFTVTVPTAGAYDLNVRYASNSPRPLDLAVNGAAAGQMAFASTDPDGTGPQEGFDNWAFLTRTVTLAAGENTIALAIPAGATTGPNLDRVEITAGGTGPIPAGPQDDTTADADGDLFLDGPDGSLNEAQAASMNFNLGGLDADIVKVELSFDGGATRADITGRPDADGDFVFDGSALPAGPVTATIIVTDAAGNEAAATSSFEVAAPAGQPIVIQAEDETRVTVEDAGTGPLDKSLTREVSEASPDAFGNYRAGADGGAYVDFGTNPGDALAFSVTAPAAGTYTATIRYANGGAEGRPLALSVNGGAASNVAFTPTGTGDAGWENWTEIAVTLDLAAGANTVRLAIPSAADGGVPNGPNIDRIVFTPKGDDGGQDGGGRPGEAQSFADVVKINFEPAPGAAFGAPAGYATPAGFEADTGAAYGERGNGFTYGWVDVEGGAVTATPKAQPNGSMRYKNAAPEASDLQKTYAHFEYPGASAADNERAWEMALENGTYELTVAIGDTGGPFDSDYLLNVEGRAFGPKWTPENLAGASPVNPGYDSEQDGDGYRSTLMTGVVQVTDGRLTLDSIGGSNTEIQWLELERIPDLTPDDGRSADLDYSFFVSPVAASLEDGQVPISIGANGELPTGIDPTSSLIVGVNLQAPGHRGPNIAHVDGIKLVETLTGIEVPVDVQITGGADSLTIRPLQDLKEFTSYTLKIEDVLDLGAVSDADAPLRRMQDLTTSFVTGEAPVEVAREVAFTEQLQLSGFADGAFGFTSTEFGPDGRLYVATIMGEIHRWDVNPDGSIDKASRETLSHDYFDQGAAGRRGIIGLTFDPEDPDVIWVSDNWPIPREGKAYATPEFSGQVSKITLGAGGAFEGAEVETYVTGLPRSGGDHVSNSLEFRPNPDAGGPDYLLYLTQGSNSAAGEKDNAWGNRPERLLSAAVLEIDRSQDAPEGGFVVKTEPIIDGVPTTDNPDGAFNPDGTYPGFYDPFADGAPVRIFATGVRNAYDLVWHSNGKLYLPTNGTAAGGKSPDDPSTPQDESASNSPKQLDYLFSVQEGGYYGHPNPLRGEYILNGGNPTSGIDPNEVGGNSYYAPGTLPDPDYDIASTYSLGFNQSPNGAIEYKGTAFGANLKGALLIAQFSSGDNVRMVLLDENGDVREDDVLRRPDGSVIDSYIDPLDIIENPATGQLYLMTLNRGSGESQLVLLTPAPGGVAGDTTADEGGDLSISAIDATDPAAVVFKVAGLDADIQAISVSFDNGATSQAVTLDAQGRFTADLSGRTGPVTARLTVRDDDGNSASKATALTLGGGGGGTGGETVIDATRFTVLSTLTGSAATVIRRIDDPSTKEPTGGNDTDGDGYNDGFDGLGYLDPNGGAEDKASFVVDAAAAGTYQLTFRMAANSERPIAVRTGDQSVAITGTDTTSFTNWTDFPITLTLQQGANTIVIAQTGGAGPNIDSVRVTPLEVEDVTADEGGDLALALVDATDPSAAVFEVTGDDADIASFAVSVDGGEAQAVTPDAQGRFTLDLGTEARQVTVTLTVTDGSANTAAAATVVTVEGEEPAANDGEETVGGVTYVVYEAENAASVGDPAEVTTAQSDRGQRGGAFVDFVGPDTESVTWTVEVAEDGTYALDILYALGAGKAARPMPLLVDGEQVSTLAFPANSNAAEDQWGPQSATVTLAAGTHTITVTAPGGVGPNVDYLRLSKAPVDVFDPSYAAVDGEARLELEAVDGSTRTLSDTEVEFYFTVDEGGVYALDVAANAGAPDGAGLRFVLNGQEIGRDAFPGQGDAGEETVFATLKAGTDYKLTVVSDRPGASALDYLDVRAAPGDADADIELRSLEPSFAGQRLHFSFLQNNSGSNPDRVFKDSALVEISNSGTKPLEFRDATIDGPFKLANPAAFDGLTLAAGAKMQVEVLFDGPGISPKPTDGLNSVYEGALRLSTNDADTPVATVDLAGFWQARDEGGQEPNVNEVWQLFGFGNVIEGLKLTGGGENSALSTKDVFAKTDATEVLSPYWKIADGVEQARITQIAAFHGDGGATLGIHAPGDKNADDIFWNHAGNQNQRVLPLVGSNGGDGGVAATKGGFSTAAFTRSDIPSGWAGTGIFGIEVANLSTDPRLNPSGPVKVAGAQQGHTVKVFQAVDGDGNPIADTYLVAMDYTGINYDYNDNLYVMQGVTPVGFGGSVTVTGLDDAAADDRLVFTNIDKPANGAQLFRDEATFTLTNDGLGPVAITGLTLGGADADDFEIVGAAPSTIPEGGSVQVTVRFTGSDPLDDNQAVLMKGTLTVETDSGLAPKVVQLAGLAQNQSEQGEEPSVAQIVEAFGYTTDVAQGQLADGGRVEAVGDEVLLPYFDRLDGSKPVEVIQLAAFLNQGNVARLSAHGLSSEGLTELFAADDQQGQTVLPDGLVPGTGDTGGVARASFNPSAPFGLKVTVDGRPTYASWTDPEANRIDPKFGQLVADDRGHLIRFFEAKDAAGNVIPGTYIGIQDYPGAGNYDYNDHMFVIRNVKAHALTAQEDANGDGVNDALQRDADQDGTVAFFDADDGAGTPGGGDGGGSLDRGDYVVGFNVGGPAVASQQGLDGVALRGDDDALIAYSGDGATRAPGTDAASNANGANALPGAFKTYRDGKAWTAEVSGLKDGAYVVVLHTQETYWNAAGKRVFDLSIDGTKVADDLDPFKAAGGGDKPVAIEALVQVTGGKFTVTLDAQGSDGIDNAALNAITVYASGDQPGGGLDTGDTGGGMGGGTGGTDDGQQPFPGPDAPIVADGTLTIAAKNYDFGGQDVAYNDAAGLQGGSNGGRAGSDVEQTGGGDVGWIGEGEWLEYTIAVPEAGDYDFDLLLSTTGAGRSAKVDVFLPDAEAPYASTGSIANPSSGSYTSFEARSGEPVTLQAGVQVVRVTFEGGSQDFRSFTLNRVGAPTAPANEAPVAAGIADQSGDEGQPFALDLADHFSDADGDALSYSASGLPEGLTISASGVITGTPVADGAYPITVTASDGSLSAQSTFTLSVADKPAPQPNGQSPFPGPNAPALAGAPLTIDASNYDDGGQGVAYNDAPGLSGGSNGGRAGSDVEQTGDGDIGWIGEGEWLEYTVDVAKAGLYDVDLLLSTAAGGRSAKVDVYLPGSDAPYASSGSIANPSTGSYAAFQPRGADGLALQAGEQVVRVTFTGGAQDFRSFTLTPQETAPVNQAPTAGALAAAEVAEDKAFTLDVAGAFSDPDGDALSFAATGLPSGVTISQAGVVTGTPADPGTYSVTVTATDPGGLKADAAFALTVDPAPAGPAQTPFPGPSAPKLAAALTVDATNFDAGGQGVSWNDNPGRDGGVKTARPGADVELVGSELDIGYVKKGEWVEYTIDVAQSGSYALSVNAKTPIAGNAVTVSLGDGQTLATFALPDSNGTSTSFNGTVFGQTAAQVVSLDAGLQTLRFAFDGKAAPNGYLLDMRSFALEAASPVPPAPTPDAPKTVTVFAGGETAAGVGPNFTVLADGQVIGSAKVTNAKASFDGTYDAFVFDLGDASPPDEIAIRFTNDRYVSPGGPGNDRNLWIDRIEIGGAVYQAEEDAVVTGDNQSVAQRYNLDGVREDMHINGTMVFDLVDLLS